MFEKEREGEALTVGLMGMGRRRGHEIAKSVRYPSSQNKYMGQVSFGRRPYRIMPMVGEEARQGMVE